MTVAGDAACGVPRPRKFSIRGLFFARRPSWRRSKPCVVGPSPLFVCRIRESELPSVGERGPKRGGENSRYAFRLGFSLRGWDSRTTDKGEMSPPGTGRGIRTRIIAKKMNRENLVFVGSGPCRKIGVPSGQTRLYLLVLTVFVCAFQFSNDVNCSCGTPPKLSTDSC